MADFKIESNIPLPEMSDPDSDDLDDDEDLVIPGKRGRKPRCRSNDLHVWDTLSDTEEKCRLCSEFFPCRDRDRCRHLDCWEARGEPYPYGEQS